MRYGISTLALVAGLLCGLATAQAQPARNSSTLGTGGASASSGASNSSGSLSNSADGSWVIHERITPKATSIYERGTGSISSGTGIDPSTSTNRAGSSTGLGSGSGRADNNPLGGGRDHNTTTAYGRERGRYGNDAPGPEGFSGGGQGPNDLHNDGDDRFRRDRGHEYEWRGEGWDRYHDQGRADRHDDYRRDWNAGGDRD